MSAAALDIILLESHEAALRTLLHRENGTEAAAYVLFGKAEIAADPWSKQPRIRLISHEVVPITSDEMVSSSSTHVTWSTQGFMRLLGLAQQMRGAHFMSHTLWTAWLCWTCGMALFYLRQRLPQGRRVFANSAYTRI